MVKDCYFIRVGSDSTKKEDPSVEVPFSMIINKKLLFIPLCDKMESKDQINQQYSYQDLYSFNKQDLMKYFGKIDLSKDFLDFHLDPFFNFNEEGEYSYGDRTKNNDEENITKAITLKEFKNNIRDKKDSYLFFLALVVEPNEQDLKEFMELPWREVRKKQNDTKRFPKKLALIGYFKVKDIEIIDKNNVNNKRVEINKKFKNNAHVRRNDFIRCFKIDGQEIILINGDPEKSKFLFENPLIFSESTKGRVYKLTTFAKETYFKNNKYDAFPYIGSYPWFDKKDLNLNELLV